MVEASAGIKQVNIVLPSPFTERGHRVPWSMTQDGKFMVYACKNNVIFRKIDNTSESYIYTDHIDAITAVSCAPKGDKFAIGDCNGKVKILCKNDQNQFMVEVEMEMFSGAVNAITWTGDAERIIAAGAGQGVFAAARNAKTGSKIGDVLGHTQTVLAAAITTVRPFKLFSAGEANEILVHEGVPFKGQAQKTIKDNTGYVNQIQMSPDNTHFATVSSDKSINLYDAKTWEKVQSIANAHKMGIYELKWLDDETIITSSADNTVKSWAIKEGKELKTHTVHNLPKTNPMYQQLGLLPTANGDFWSVTLNGTLNHWNSREDEAVSNQVICHRTLVNHITRANSTVVYSSEERIFYFEEADLTVKELHDHKHTQKVNLLATTDASVYSADIANMLCRNKVENGELSYAESADVGANVLGMGFDNEHAFALLQQGKMNVYAKDTLELKHQVTLPIQATHITVSKHTGEIWLSEKLKVFVYKFDGELHEVHQFDKHTQKVSVLSVSADGKYVASGDDYRYIYVHDAETKAEVQSLGYHKSGLKHVNFSADGSRVATMSQDFTFGIADVASKKDQVIVEPHGRKGVNGIVFSQDEQKVFTVGLDNAIRVWSL